MVNKMKILILPGDGVGPEVTNEAVKVIQAVSDIYNLGVELDHGFFGGVAVEKYGHPFPDETKEKISNCEAVLLGAVGGPQYDDLQKNKKTRIRIIIAKKAIKFIYKYSSYYFFWRID